MLASLVRMVLSSASPPGGRGRLSVLIYHRVLPLSDPLLPGEPSAAEFETTMRWVKSTFNVLPLGVAVECLRDGRLPDRALCITFDDGYADNATVAGPVLSRLGLHATFFIATGFLDGGRMFNDTVIEAIRAFRGDELDLRPLGLAIYRTGNVEEKSDAIDAILRVVKYVGRGRREELVDRIRQCVGVDLPDDLMMSSEQVVGLAKTGFALGGHTQSHPILAQLEPREAAREIETGKRKLEELVGGPVDTFAYPNGRPDKDYAAATVDLVRRAGFKSAVCTAPGAAHVGSDIFQIPRFTPWDTTRLRFSARMWLNLARTEFAQLNASSA